MDEVVGEFPMGVVLVFGRRRHGATNWRGKTETLGCPLGNSLDDDLPALPFILGPGCVCMCVCYVYGVQLPGAR